MKRLLVALTLGGVGWLWCTPVQAHPLIRVAFQQKYVAKSENAALQAAFRTANCNVCHLKGTTKRDPQNTFGKELAKVIEGNVDQRIKQATAAGRAARDAEIAKLKIEFEKAFEQVTKMKSPTGETYEERIKAGKLPVEIESVPPGEEDEGEEEEE